MTDSEKATIMAVDDQPANLRLLQDLLGQQDYQLRLFPHGRSALSSATQNPPDLILLDINMPEMTGFEVCEQFKSNSKLREIPVIFLSALNQTEDKVNAFRCGGVDYITKPFQVEEVQSRVETHLQLYRLRRALQEQAAHLEEIVSARTLKLAEALSASRAAERLEQTMSSILEQIAGNEPLESIFANIVALVEGQRAGCAAILMINDGRMNVIAAPQVPVVVSRQLPELLEANSSQRSLFCLPLEDLSPSLKIEVSNAGLQFQTIAAAPFQSDGDPLGYVLLLASSTPRPRDLQLLERSARVARVALQHFIFSRQLTPGKQRPKSSGPIRISSS